MRFHALSALTAVALVLTGCANAPARPRERPLAPNPSAIIAAELAFARLAQDKGQWTAFRETARDDAVMFVPRRVRAQDWLKGRADPPRAVRWQPHAVYASCDGSAGVTTGAWQDPSGAHGYFTTVWTRLRDGSFKWVLDHGVPLDGPPRAADEFITARQAVCGTRPPVALVAGAEGEDLAMGLSADQTLSWTSRVQADAARRITIRLWDGTAMQTVVDDVVPAAEAAAGG